MKKLIQLLAMSSVFACTSAFSATDNMTPSSTSTTEATATSSPSNAANSSDAAASHKKVMSMSNVLQQLQKAGYIVKTIDFNKDNSQYTVEAIDKHGEKQSINVDAVKGIPADMKKAPHEVPLAQVIKKYEKNGAYVKSATVDNSNYKITVVDSKGNEQNYTVDIQTGKQQAS